MLRLCALTMTAVGTTADNMREFVAAARTTHNARWQPNTWTSITRALLAFPVLYLHHANFVLPFPYMLSAQACTLAATSLLLRLSSCLVFDDEPGSLYRSQQLCLCLKVGMHYLSMLLGRPPREAIAAATKECQGVDGLVLVTLYVSVFVLVVLPSLAVYFIELEMKLGFIKQRQYKMQHAWPCLESRLCKAVVVYGAVVGSYIACEVVVLILSPMQCTSAGIFTAW